MKRAKKSGGPQEDGTDSERTRLGRPSGRDVVSGFVTGLFSIPEGMAYASIGGFAAPLGLWSGIVPTIVGSVFARTVLMVTTLTSAIALCAQSVLAGAGLSSGDLGAIATLTVLVGVVMLLLGLLGLGSVMSFVSASVMTGFTTGIALQILAGVVKDATGYAPTSDNTLGKVIEAFGHVGDWDTTVVLVTTATVAVWFLARLVPRLRPLALLIALLVASVGVALLHVDVELVRDIGAIPRSLPPFVLPDLSTVASLAPGAIAVALVALSQAAGIGSAVANPDGTKPDASRDFTAQGLANIAGGFFSALPTGGSLSRTGVATAASAGTRWSGIFAGIWLALIVLVAGPQAGYIPMAVIGGLMLVVGGELITGRWADITLVVRTSWLSTAAMVVTFAATTFLPLQQAIFIGAGLSILLSAVNVTRTGRLIELVRTGDGWRFEDVPAVLPSGRTTVLHYSGSGFFAEVNRIQDEWPDTSQAHDAAIVVSVRGSAGVPSATFLKALDGLAHRLHEQSIALVICGVPDSMRDRLVRTGGMTTLGTQNVVTTTDQLSESLERGYARAEALRTGRPPDDTTDGSTTDGPDS